MKIREVQDMVCAKYKITRVEMLGSSKKAKYAFPRHMAMYLCRLEGYSYPEIAFYFKRKNHTTIIYAFRKIKKKVEESH